MKKRGEEKQSQLESASVIKGMKLIEKIPKPAAAHDGQIESARTHEVESPAREICR
jgi:hypothetical protein